ncbi:hypothetical protein [Ferrimonas gelatinilytica]|uniref:DUF350 domain-containing protein n=1 Tax=Ferrimonas gelatinilytica TaxID=1255257 RepID=A0ABP9S734_9GAMM
MPTWLETLWQYPLLLPLGMKLLVGIALFVLARVSYGWFAGVDSTRELSERDNVAFGISLAGGILALAVALSGIFHLPSQASLTADLVWTTGLGLAALILIRVSRRWYDRWGLHQINKREQILDGNLSMAMVDGAVGIAISLVLKGMLQWLGTLSLAAVPLMAFNFFIAIGLLVTLTRILEYRYRRHNQGGSLQQALGQDHRPVALRHCGYLLACGLVIQTAGWLQPYDPSRPLITMAAWFFWALLGLLLLTLLSILLRTLVLAHVRVDREVEMQNNGGIAALDGALAFAVAYLICELVTDLSL